MNEKQKFNSKMEAERIPIPEFLTQKYYEKTIQKRRVMARFLPFLKISALMFLVVLMTLSLVACGKANPEESSEKASEKESDDSSSPVTLDTITDDFEDVTASLRQKQGETFEKVGTTFEEYQKNKGLIDEWVELVLSETDALFAKTREDSIAYFKQIAADPDHKYREFCEEALDEYYDMVYEDAMDIYYDEIYDEAMEELYDTYYDGIIDDAFDYLEYSQWSNASSQCYKTWSEASSAVYKKWSDESSYLYGLWSTINTAFCWDENYDVDAIVAEYENGKKVEDTETRVEDETESSTSTSGETSDGLRAEFKEAMDSYEAFYDEYCDFMVKYKENSMDMELIAEYGDMLIRLSEMEEAFAEWEDDLNDEELEYYLEVSNRITQKLLEVS